MGRIIFDLHFCGGPWDGTFTPEIMIAQPMATRTLTFDEQELERTGIAKVSTLTALIKQAPELQQALGEWGIENFSWERVYVPKQNYLLALQEDKTLRELFTYFGVDPLQLVHFCVGGGASIHNETSYRFTIHPDEKIHHYLPHVHVEKDGVEIRYSLQDLKPLDELKQPHTRDYKRRILPFLEKKREFFLDLWKLYHDGYLPPSFTESGQQFYPES